MLRPKVILDVAVEDIKKTIRKDTLGLMQEGRRR